MQPIPESLKIGVGPEAEAIHHLNQILRMELAAVASYRLSVSILETGPLRELLLSNAENHHRRAELLRREIEVRGGTPLEHDLPWKYFEVTFEPATDLDGTLEALREGEDLSLSDYLECVETFPEELRAIIENGLLPQQQRTCQAIHKMKRWLH